VFGKAVGASPRLRKMFESTNGVTLCGPRLVSSAGDAG